MFYPRQIFKVRWFTGYRLEGRYDDKNQCPATFVIPYALIPTFLIPDVLTPTYVISDALPLCHPGRYSEPGPSCSVKCFTPDRYSKCGGLLDTGSKAGMTKQNQGPATFVIPDTPTPPSFRTLTSTPVLPDALIPTFVIPGALTPPPSSPTHLPLRHPGRDSEPGSSCSVACFTPGRYSKCGGLLDTGSGPAPAYEPGAGMTTTGLPACRKLCPNFLSISDAPTPTFLIPDVLIPTFVISDALPPLSSRTR
jgi:hypothetical protein